MTPEELEEYGYMQKGCLIGVLYFRGGFLGKLSQDGKFDLRSMNNDMKSIAVVNTIDELKRAEGKYRRKMAWVDLRKAFRDMKKALARLVSGK